jgi:hypothetical protein
MNKFDKVINEAGVWNTMGDMIGSAGRIANIAKQAATSPSLNPFIDLFSKFKSKLKPVEYKTAEASSTKSEEKVEMQDYSSGIVNKKKFIFSKNSVIFEDGQMVARTISSNDNLIKTNFKQFILDNTKYNIDTILKTMERNKSFWVIVSPKGQLTVNNTRKESEKEDQQQAQAQSQQEQPQTQTQTKQAGSIRTAIGTAVGNIGKKLSGESTKLNFDYIIEKVKSGFLLEQTEKKIKNVVPFNEIDYDTFFIYNSNFSKNIGKFIITPTGKQPNPKVGQFIKTEGNFKGLALVGNQTNYAKWYFCNEFESYEQTENEKDQGPVKSDIKGIDRTGEYMDVQGSETSQGSQTSTQPQQQTT